MTNTIVAGAALSLTGRFAVQGEQARRGLELWAEHVNRQGGLRVRPSRPPRPVELRIYDDGSKIAGATAATEHLIADDGVELLFSPYGSVLALAAAEVAERHGRVLWNHGGSSDALEQRGFRHLVTLLSSASRYFVPVLDLAVQQAGTSEHPIRTVALLHGASGTFPRAVIGSARDHAVRLGLEIVLDEPYPPPPLPNPGDAEATGPPDPCSPLPRTGTSARRAALPRSPLDSGAPRPRGPVPVAKPMFAPRSGGAGGEGLSPLASRLARLRPDLILGVGTTEADLAFAQALRAHSVEARLIGLVAAPIERFREVLGADADGLCGPSQWEPTLGGTPDLGPTSAQFGTAFRDRFGLEPDYPAAQAYAAGLIAARCADLAGSLENDALRRAAGTLDLTTFYGRFRLDRQTGRQVGHTMVVAQWQAGRKQIVWPAAVRTAPYQAPVPTALPTTRPSTEAPSS
jgi:ABC-type branched-subunit amino acid transport system substrate-binding protein